MSSNPQTVRREISVTGPRKGRNRTQARQGRVFLDTMQDRGFDLRIHHGDCVGVDAAWHTDALLRNMKVEVYPPIDERYRAFSYGAEGLVTIHDPKPYLERNIDLVDASQILVGTSATAYETKRSGTWWTIRYARHVDIPRFIIWPSGHIQFEWKDETRNFVSVHQFFAINEYTGL